MSLDIAKLKEHWRTHQGQVRVRRRDLRDGRPELPPVEGSPCERCGEWTPEIACLFVDYWLCPRCVAFFAGLTRWAAQMQRN